MSVCQILGIILENKVVQTLKLENNVFAKKCFPKLIFLHEKKQLFFTSKINFESIILAILTNHHSSTNFFPLSTLILG